MMTVVIDDTIRIEASNEREANDIRDQAYDNGAVSVRIIGLPSYSWVEVSFEDETETDSEPLLEIIDE